MAFGTANRVALRHIEESTWGTTPSTPQLDPIRFTDESLNFNAEFVTSQEIRSDRMTPDTVLVSVSAAGDINAELSYETFDQLMEGAMFSDWVTTGDTVSAATDIAINKTAGTPNTYQLESDGAMGTDFTAQSWTVGQFLKIEGFDPAGTFYAQIVSIAADTLVIYPLTDVVDDAAGDSVTITPLNFLRNGVTNKSYTIQKAFTDLSTPEYWNFAGSRVNTWSLEFATGAILKTSFGIMAKDAQMTESQFGSATTPDANTNTVLNSVNNVVGITFDGDPGASSFFFNNLSINLNNNLRGQEAVGTLGYIGLEPGRIALTGSMELYFETSALFDRFRAATAFSLSFRVVDDAGNQYIVTVPRAKFTGMEIVAGGLDQDIFAQADFEGLVNAAGTYQYQISRLAA